MRLRRLVKHASIVRKAQPSSGGSDEAPWRMIRGQRAIQQRLKLVDEREAGVVFG